MYNEIERIQNPALGAIILWKFIDAYNENQKVYDKRLLELIFMILPITYNEEICNYVKTTRRSSGLNKVIEKMMNDKKIDYIYQISDNIQAMRELTIQSIQIAVASKLITINKQLELKNNFCKKLPKNYEKIKNFIDVSQKLGEWFSKMNIYEIEQILKVRF